MSEETRVKQSAREWRPRRLLAARGSIEHAIIHLETAGLAKWVTSLVRADAVESEIAAKGGRS